MNKDEDIKIVEELLKEFKTYNDLDGIQDLRLYIKAIENLLSRLKTAERMNDVLADNLRILYAQHEPCDIEITETKRCDKYKNCNECIKEWARKKVEDESKN